MFTIAFMEDTCLFIQFLRKKKVLRSVAENSELATVCTSLLK